MTGGTGLGLAIVKGFADAMGLRASACNRTNGEGSPLRNLLARDAATQRADRGTRTMTAQILIVDDEPAIRRLVRGAVERAGLSVDEAVNASDALSMARREGCELVLLDLGLPDRDGLELVPLIKAMDRAVIVLTARDATAEKVAALDLGADDYVVKPFDTDELLARMRTALRHRMTVSSSTGIVAVGAIAIDVLAHKVTLDGEDVRLTRKEFAVLVELARYPGTRRDAHSAFAKCLG